jgi:hypothetical protein
MRKKLRRSGEGVKGRCLPWSKEEEGGYIFWMKQVPVHMTLSAMNYLLFNYTEYYLEHWLNK